MPRYPFPSATHLFPEEVVIDLLGVDEVFQLVQTSESSKFEPFPRHTDGFEDVMQLTGTR